MTKESSASLPDIELHKALAGLPARQREVVVLRYLEQLSVRETRPDHGVSRRHREGHATQGATQSEIRPTTYQQHGNNMTSDCDYLKKIVPEWTDRSAADKRWALWHG